jgi:hypothetical protein
MVVPDSDDYELTPSRELDDLRREVSSLKKNSLTDGDKAKVLIESMDRLTISINRLITILDDAQKDIIDEYQESKPVEKLNQILEQNETIAKALISMSENAGGSSGSRNPLPSSSSYSGAQSYPDIQQMPQPAQSSMQQQMSQPMQQQIQQQMQQRGRQGNDLRNILPISNSPYMNAQGQQSVSFNPSSNMSPMSPPSMSPMDDFPPMDDIPPLDSPAPSLPKKKFLGIM